MVEGRGERRALRSQMLGFHQVENASTAVAVAHVLRERGFELDERDCELLRAEAVMYYHRYLAEFVLEDYPAVERDTQRNLRVMDFCASHAADPADRHVLEQYRPYVIMMRTRARSAIELGHNRPKSPHRGRG